MNKTILHENQKFQRPPSRIRTRFIAFSALLISVITFTSGINFVLFMKEPDIETQLKEIMKRPNFENQFYRDIIKRLTPIINYEIEKRFEEVN